MKKCFAVAWVSLMSLGTASIAAAASSIDLDSDGWVKLAEGVYQREDVDGSVTRLGFDAGGAQYDRTLLENEIRALEDKIAFDGKNAGTAAELAELKRALAGIPVVDPVAKSSPGAQIMSSQSGVLCGFITYSFDSHLSVGKVGATATARTAYGPDAIGPSPIASGITQYAQAKVSPAGETAITVTKSLSTDANWMAPATADWVKANSANYPVGTSSCTAYTQSYISMSASNGCTPSSGGYASMTKNYTSCVTTP